MLIRLIDFETTGLNDDREDVNRHAIVEAGWYDYSDEVPELSGKYLHSTLVNSGKEISIEARAVHHISNAEAATGIKPDALLPQLMAGPPSYFCAHNIDFEKQFFGGGEVSWLCTYKAALRVCPEAPGHKLQELRYFFDVDNDPDFDRDLAERPHRAPDDAYILAFVLRRLLKVVPIEDMARWSKGPALLHMCFLKKYKGTPWRDVPKDYLDWIVNKSDISDRDIRATAKFYLTRK